MKLFQQRSISESFGSDRSKNVKFSSTNITDPHIQYIIKEVVKKINSDPSVIKKITEKDVEEEIVKKTTSVSSLAKKAPVIYNTISQNSVEEAAYTLMDQFDIKPPTAAPAFSVRMFYQLVNYIKSEYDEFFPLRDIKTNKPLKEAYIFVPDNTDSEYNSVPTAAATKDGTFIFNVNFINRLLEFGHLKNVVVNSKKYKSQGGPIPDPWGYVEFLIIHEYLHYTQADWDLSKYYKVDPKLTNWVGDFRNNYVLVKRGLPQLPIGLFSSEVNYDKQLTFKQMVDIVRKEWENLKDKEKDDVSKDLDKQMDDHSQQDPENQQGDQSDQDGDQSDQSDQSDQDGDQGDQEGDLEKEREKAEQKAKQNQEKISKAKPISKIKKSNSQSQVSQPSTDYDSHSTTGPESVKWRYIPPKFNWKALLRKLVGTGDAEPEETYMRQSRSAAGQTVSLANRGITAMKPGEYTPDSKLKLLLCVDSSGSMTSAIGKVYSELSNLLKNTHQLDKYFAFVRFSTDAEMYLVNLKRGQAARINSIKEKPTKTVSVDISKLFSEHLALGTNLSSTLGNKLREAMGTGYYVVLISDTDVVEGASNRNVLKSLLSNNKFFFITDSKESYIHTIKIFGARGNVLFFD